jgi:N6-adenosine-specific RNA methylase IME4
MGELAKIESFRKQLALVETFQEIQLIGNAAEKYQQLMMKQKVSTDAQNEIGEFIIEVEEKKGEYLNKNYPHGSAPGESGKLRGAKSEPCKMPASKKESTRARTIKKADKKKKDKIKDKIKKAGGVITPNKLFSELKKEEKQEQIEDQKQKILSGEMSLPEGIFDVIVVDPPWPYGRKYDPNTSRSANPYPEMSIDEIKNIILTPDKDCILWLWTTHRFIWDAKNIMDLWGFEYKGILVWNKEKMGMGDWLRMQCEFCLVGIKGKPLWDVKDLRDIIIESRTEHSSKPDSFYQMIDDKFVSKNKADYFGRKERKGWKINNGKINLK